MKNKSVKAASLMIFIITMLALGCSQAAGSASISKSTDVVQGQDNKTAVNATTQVTNTTTTSSSSSNPPSAPTEADLIKISEILGNPKNYDGKTVAVQGKIVSECGSGCWFTLQDGNAVIYIDLAPNNLVIPQKKGSNAKVIGKVIKEGSDVYMIGSKVDF